MKELGSEEKVRQRTVEKKWTTPAENRLPGGRRRCLDRRCGMRKHTFVFGALVVFSVLYFYRPEDFVPGLDYIPMAKIVGAAGFLALIFGIASSGKFKLPWALRILVLLLGQMTLAIPFAVWRGGAFDTVFTRFSKGVVAALLIGLAVSTTRQIRKLLWIQVSAVALVTFLSIALNHRRDGRLEGIQNGILMNPNDLAINIAITFPLGVAFMLQARSFKKALWVIALTFMCLGIILTYVAERVDRFCCHHHGLRLGVWNQGKAPQRGHSCGPDLVRGSRHSGVKFRVSGTRGEHPAGEYRGFA